MQNQQQTIQTSGKNWTLQELIDSGEAAAWTTNEAYETLRKGYLIGDETPRQMYWRVANSSAKYLNRPDLAKKFFTYIDNNWLCLATPVASNSGSLRGLPISCYSSSVGDSVDQIFQSFHETAMLTKYGGGCGKYWGKLRQKGSIIKGNGISDGIIPWLKVEEATLQSTSQGGVRRGSGAQYLDIETNEFTEFLDIRRPTGDPSRRCLSNNFHHAFCISDSFMKDCLNGNSEARDKWEKLLNTRLETGEPYIMFNDTVNRTSPDCYRANSLTINCSNLCSEILLFNDENHTFVCCLSSLNLARWEEWKDTDLVETSIYFLEGIMSEFIDKASKLHGFENAVKFSVKSRALGLGVLGWHTLLQKKFIPFESFQAMQLNAEIFRIIDERSLRASRQLAAEYGEPEWCKGFGIRNSHRLAIAPTMSNALISGGVSQGIEPIVANCYAQKTAKGTFIRRNKQLEQLLEKRGYNTVETWNLIIQNKGSVRKLDFLSSEEKEVFATAREIDQLSIIRQASQRQQWIDQGQSVNIFVSTPKDLSDQKQRIKVGNYLQDIHWEAWELGIKTLYYCRAEAVLQGDMSSREESNCKSCEG